MQYFALDDNKERVFAPVAEKGKDYTCPECGMPVRRRRSRKHRAHFYHRRSPKKCHHKNKSLLHLALQQHIFSLFPPGEAHLEYRFSEISRVADVSIPSKGLVFEIQCSKISPEEAAARRSDYASLGIELVWILHDKVFKKPLDLSYFTDGIKIYDRADKSFYTESDSKFGIFRNWRQRFALGSCRCRDRALLKTGEGETNAKLGMPMMKKPNFESRAVYTVDLTRPLMNDRPVAGKGAIYFVGDLVDRGITPPTFDKKQSSLYLTLLEKLYLYLHPTQNSFCRDNALTRQNRRQLPEKSSCEHSF